MHFRGDNFDHNVPAWIKSLGGWVRDVVDFCYPGLCPACREPSAPGKDLCAECASQLAILAQTPACFLCGGTLAYSQAPCPRCRGRGVPHYERVIRLGKFDPPVRALIHQLKYHRAWTVGEMLADQLLALDHVESLLLEADCLLPVPLHGLRRFARGYNQSEVIADRISALRDIPIVRSAVRIRNTETQTHHHSRARRMSNLKGSFVLRDPGGIRGRRVVVVDDVMTTGATLRTLAQTLKAARPKSLCALVVAVAEKERN